MDVRTMTTADLDAALDLWRRTEHLGTVPRSEVEGVLGHDPDLVLVAAEGADVIGVVIGTYDGRRGWIQRLAVDPDRRRGGIARALVAELERRLAARGCGQVNLLVYDDNVAGRRFWDDLGYAGSERVVLYRRRLGPPVPTPGRGDATPATDDGGRPTDC